MKKSVCESFVSLLRIQRGDEIDLICIKH